MLEAATISKAYFSTASSLAQGPGSALVGELLTDIAGPRMCVVEIERTDGRFSLILDPDWAELGLEVSVHSVDPSDDYFTAELPRPALLAVVAGWPQDWDARCNPSLGVHVSTDMVPHVSLSELGAINDSSHPGPQPAL